MNLVTSFLDLKIIDHNIYRTVPERMPGASNEPSNMIRLRNIMYSFKQSPQLRYNSMNTFLHSLVIIQCLASPNLCLHSDSNLIHLYINVISMLYWEAATKAAVIVNTQLWEKKNTMFIAWVHQSLASITHHKDTRISYSLKVYNISIPRWFGIEYILAVLIPLDCNVQFHLVNNQGENIL